MYLLIQKELQLLKNPRKHTLSNCLNMYMKKNNWSQPQSPPITST